MTSTLDVRRGDTLPALVATLTDGPTGAPVDLTAATRVRVLGKRGTATIVDEDQAGRSATGVVTRAWQAADTLTVGTLRFVIQVTWPGGKVQTFPGGDDELVVRITPNYP